MTDDLQAKLTGVSSKPGVYLMKDDAAQVIYVGKAANLKKRLASYFQRPFHTDLKTGLLVKKIKAFDTIVTGTEQEALILEANLIRKYRPRYNVVLKDDKRFLSICINIKEQYPCLTLTRKIEKTAFSISARSHLLVQCARRLKLSIKLSNCVSAEIKN